jgi:hypothetical protein
MTTVEVEIVPLGIAARAVGIPSKTLSARLRRGQLTAFRSGRDHRHLLVDLSEVKRFLEPTPVETGAPDHAHRLAPSA